MTTRPGDTAIPRRTALASLGAGGLALACPNPGRQAAAQEATPGPTASHALVGTWFLTESSANLTNARDLFTLHGDGTYIEANADGSVRLGAWAPTSATTASLIIVADARGEDGADIGGQILRLAITLNPDGQTYTAEGTIEFRSPDGTLSGQIGPIRGAASRLGVEAPGTPVMTPEEFFGGAPGATPAA